MSKVINLKNRACAEMKRSTTNVLRTRKYEYVDADVDQEIRTGNSDAEAEGYLHCNLVRLQN